MATKWVRTTKDKLGIVDGWEGTALSDSFVSDREPLTIMPTSDADAMVRLLREAAIWLQDQRLKGDIRAFLASRLPETER